MSFGALFQRESPNTLSAKLWACCMAWCGGLSAHSRCCPRS